MFVFLRQDLPRRNRLRIPQGRQDFQDVFYFSPFPDEREKTSIRLRALWNARLFGRSSGMGCSGLVRLQAFLKK